MQRDYHVVVDRVTKEYPTKQGPLKALKDVSLSVMRGEFVAVVGPSGCGKSTLLRIIAGLIPTSAGEVTIGGVPVRKPVRVGMVFQSPALLPWRSALDNVLLAVNLAGFSSRSYRRRALDLLELVGLSEFAERKPSELSGGMQQRVGLCRALVHDPELLLMDEPFGALDALTRDQMSFELLRIWSASEPRKTIVFVTHSIPEAVFLADQICVMTSRPGQIDDILQSDLSRPRSLDLRGSAEFGDQVLHIYKRLEIDRGAEVHD